METCNDCGREATVWWAAGGRMLFGCCDCSSAIDAYAHQLSAYPDGPHALEVGDE